MYCKTIKIMLKKGNWYFWIVLLLIIVFIIDWNVGFLENSPVSHARFWRVEFIMVGLLAILLGTFILRRKK